MIFEEFFRSIELQYKSNMPFVVYRKPNNKKVNSFLQNSDELYFVKDFTEQGFVFSPFDHIEKSVLIPTEKSQVNITLFEASDTFKKSPSSESISYVSKEDHINLINKCINEIKNSNLKKVVVSRKETINFSETNPITIFKRLLNAYESAFVYCWYHPKVGLWLGATPETLIKIEGLRFSIMALAGTKNYAGNLDVEWQNKEKEEQQIVTDFIIENLKPSVVNYEVSDIETVKAGNLVHLKTMISAQLRSNIKLKQLINALHPTPAVCGLPKATAKQFILNNEGYNREFYTGFLGELNFQNTKAPRAGKRNIENRAYSFTKKSTQLYVNLRCMQIKNQQAIIYVGGGITIASNPESEWEETVAKTSIIKNVL